MKQNTRIALAGLLTATGAALHALAEEITSVSPSATTDKPEAPQEPAEAPKPKRAPKAEKAAQPTPPQEPATPAEPEKPADAASAADDEESQEDKDKRYQENRAKIQPYVQNPNWTADKRAALKGILAKLSPGTGALVDLPLANQEAFERDFDALTI